MSKYYEAAKILENSKNQSRCVKNLVFKSSYQNKKELYAIVMETLKYNDVLDIILKKFKLYKKNEIFKNKNLCKVLIYDHLYGQGVSVSGKLMNAFKKYKIELKELLQKFPRIEEKETKCKSDQFPRFVRINTLIQPAAIVIKDLENCGYICKKFTGSSYNDYIKCIQKLRSKEFIVDPHIDNLTVFAFDSRLHLTQLYKNGCIILQDKASCIPASVLNPPEGSHIIDACAAPGNKASHLAALISNKGQIFAFDRSAERFKLMKSLLSKAGATCVKSINKDFLKCDPLDPMFRDVQYILVDPSCSGSGIIDRFNEAKEDETPRLKSLSNLQATLLKHALSFPRVLKVVYSTCSINEVENERVVGENLQKFKGSFELSAVFPHFPNRGNSGVFPEAYKCLYMRPDRDRTNGFFVACFSRIKDVSVVNTAAVSVDNAEKASVDSLANASVNDVRKLNSNNARSASANDTVDVSVNRTKTRAVKSHRNASKNCARNMLIEDAEHIGLNYSKIPVNDDTITLINVAAKDRLHTGQAKSNGKTVAVKRSRERFNDKGLLKCKKSVKIKRSITESF